ncbi:hypothetical protein ACXPJX_004228 [Serratia marcescens]
MIKNIGSADGLMGTMKARAELNSAAFSEMLGAADGKGGKTRRIRCRASPRRRCKT